MKSTLRAAGAVVCILIITICAILIGQKVFRHVRIDLTERKLYTLSDGTRNILSKLNQPVHLKLYYSRKAAMEAPEDIRYYNNYYLYVRDLLEEYVGLSEGMLDLQVIDPRPFSDQEQRAMRYGLQHFPLTEEESFFFGLVAQTELGKTAAIEFFEPGRQQVVEYEISKLLVQVTRRQRKRLGVLASLPVTGGDVSPYMRQMMQAQGRRPPQAWTITQRLREQYEVESVAEDSESIDPELDYLMVIHPKDLPEKTLFAIDQYVMKGGRLIVFTDPQCLADQPQQPSPYARQQKTSSDLNALLSGWGVEMVPGAVAADPALAVTASIRPNQRPQPIPTFLNLNSDTVNAQEVITSQMDDLRMLFPGALKKVGGDGAKVVPLLQTTENAGTWRPEGPMQLALMDPGRIARQMEPADEPLMLAARITGRLETNFPDGPPATEEETEEAEKAADEESAETDESPDETDAGQEPVPEEEPAGSPASAVQQAEGETTVLVFADVDMISDMVAYQSSFFGTSEAGDNAALVMNAVEFLGGGSDLIEIRSRGRFSRPFEMIERIKLQTRQATSAEVEKLNQKIDRYRRRLRELGAAGPGEDAELLESKALTERKRIQAEIREARKQLRELNAGRRRKIEALKSRLQFHNIVWAPAGVLLIAVVLWGLRYARARHYAARRSEG